MATIEQMKEKQREIGLRLCYLLNVDPGTVHVDWDLEDTSMGPVWIYSEIVRDKKGRAQRENGDIVYEKRRVLLPMDVYTAVLDNL